MRYSFISAAVLAFVSSVSAGSPTADFDPISVPSSKTDTVAAGSTYTIKWTAPAKYNGTVTIKLLEGASAGTLTIADDEIDSGVDNSDNSYDWDIPSDIESFPLYGIQISWDSDPTIFQWSFPFHITGSTSGSSSSSSSASGPVSTKTVQVSPVTSSTASPTSTSVKTTSSASTNSTTVLTVTSSTAPTAASNGTLSTSGSLRPTTTSSSSSRTSSAPAAATSTGAAMANLAKGSFAVFGGAVLAFVL